MMTISNRRWEQVKKYFSDEEKADIDVAQTGESPALHRGYVVDESQLSRELQSKLRFHLMEPAPHHHQRTAAPVRTAGASV